jgi:hypothetical protein
MLLGLNVMRLVANALVARISTVAALHASGFPFHQYVQPQAAASTLRILVEDPGTAEVGSLIIPLSQIK